MKIKGVWIVFFLALTSLLVFQSIWLYDTYYSKVADIQNNLEKYLNNSYEKEVRGRYEKHISNEKIVYTKGDSSILEKAEILGHIELNDQETLEAGIYQQILEHSGYSFNLNTLDSIFQDELQNADIAIKYSLCYKDSTGTILDQTGNLPLSKMNKAFHTDSLLIVDGKRVQAIVDISPSVVFKQMLSLLLASLLMFIIILFCIAYQTKIIFTQHKLNKLREDFTHALTHDMKTPLGSINTVLSNFRGGVLDNNPEKQERFGRIAMDQVTNLLLLVEKILTIAKIERGKFILNRSKTNLYATIKELEERFSVSNEKPVTIHISFRIDENKIIYIDATLIKNAIANLIDNAIKYSGDSVNIDIDCYLIDKSLYIRVSDNGFGISEKDQRKIFEKFERGAAVGRKGAKGFGLGLTYVKQVTEAHGGLVTIFSNEGKWSEFTITLPLHEPDNY